MPTDSGIRLKGQSLPEFVATFAPMEPPLPFTHVMDVLGLEQQLERCSIAPEPCDVYHPAKILYLFYGRTSFRPNMGATSSTLEHMEPVCFLFKPSAIGAIARLYPFDTGAHHLGFYTSALHKRMERDEFKLDADIKTAQRAVNAFFGSNRAYVFVEPRRFSDADLDQRAKAFVELIHDRSQRDADDRSSAIEVQLEKELQIAGNVLAIVASRARCEELSAKRALIPWLSNDVALVPYFSFGRSNPREIFGAMRQVAADWLNQSGFLT